MTDKSQTEDLKKDQQKRAIDEVLKKLARQDPSTYYLSAIQIAEQVKNAVDSGEGINQESCELLKGLSKWDIQMLMSFHPQ